MNKDKNEAQLKSAFSVFIKDASSKLIDIYGLGNITVNFDIVGNQGISQFEGAKCVFEIKYIRQYRQAMIHCYPMALDMFKKGQMKHLIGALAHEFAHPITWRMFELANDRHSTKKEIEEATEEETEMIACLCRRILMKEYSELYNYKYGEEPTVKTDNKPKAKLPKKAKTAISKR